VNSSLRIEAGAGGFQELDLDVEATTLKKANNYLPTGVPAAEAVGGSLPASLYQSAKPAWFGNLAWPPFDPASPKLSYEAIPAGYRYVNGKEAPGITVATRPKTPVGLKVTPQ
jgi:hypothetical protein